MSEAGVTTKKVSKSGGCASPGIGILKSWQGIVEIVLRVIVIVLSVCLIIAGASAEDAIEEIPQISGFEIPLINPKETDAAAGWLICVGAVALGYELIVILQRFINFSICNSVIIAFIIADVVVHAIIALGAFAGGVALATYVPDYKTVREFLIEGEFPEEYETLVEEGIRIANNVIRTMEASAVFGLALIFPTVILLFFVLIGGLVLKWEPTRGSYK